MRRGTRNTGPEVAPGKSAEGRVRKRCAAEVKPTLTYGALHRTAVIMHVLFAGPAWIARLTTARRRPRVRMDARHQKK